MVKNNIKKPIVLMLSLLLISGAALAGGCLGTENDNPPETPLTQTIVNASPQEAFALIQENLNNPDFVILDVRTSGEFTEEHIENAINLDYYSDTFQDDLNQLDKNKTCLIYSQSGGRSGEALDMMAELDFSEVYNMLGGITQWTAQGLPSIRVTQQIIEVITPQEAFALIQENQNNPDFIIIDIRTPEEFAEKHIENAINLDYNSDTFTDWLNILDKNKTYLIYDQSGDNGADALDMMAELDFMEVYNMLGGITQWEEEELPISQEIPQILENITVQEAFALVQENQSNPDFVIVDLRSPEEFAEGRIEDAINIYYESETFQDEISQLDRNKTCLIYWSCACGHRSDKTLEMMGELNFREVYNMRSGSDKWVVEGYPLVK